MSWRKPLGKAAKPRKPSTDRAPKGILSPEAQIRIRFMNDRTIPMDELVAGTGLSIEAVISLLLEARAISAPEGRALRARWLG